MKKQIKKITDLKRKLKNKITHTFGRFNHLMDVLNGMKLIKGVKTFFTLKLLCGVMSNFVGNVVDVMDFVLSVSDLF
jgi:hypothetical protein